MARYTTMGLIVRATPHVAILGASLRNQAPTSSDTTNSPEAELIKESQAQPQLPFSTPKKKKVDPIILLDIDYYKNSRGRKLTWDLTFRDRIMLPTVPLEMEFDPSPNWNTVASIGRNAPFYNYSGAEDTLSFKIDWYSKEDHKEDVIYACKWVEALTKSNGYKSSPHRIMIIWGGDDRLFFNDTWIVQKATYTMSQFQKHRSMLPQQAYQEIVLKKVIANNSERDDVFNTFINSKAIPMDYVRYTEDNVTR